MLALENLRLHHRGHDTPAFLSVSQPGRLYPGDRISSDGQNGCGKSSLLEGGRGLYGAGAASPARGRALFFAGQEPDVPDRLMP